MSDSKTKPRVDDIVQKYILLRDRKKDMKAEFDAKVKDIDDALDKCEAFLLNELDAQGVESYKTKLGTAYISLKTTATVADKAAFLAFVKERDDWELMDVRANKTAVDDFRKTEGNVPPGVNWSAIRAVNVRRS